MVSFIFTELLRASHNFQPSLPLTENKVQGPMAGALRMLSIRLLFNFTRAPSPYKSVSTIKSIWKVNMLLNSYFKL